MLVGGMREERPLGSSTLSTDCNGVDLFGLGLDKFSRWHQDPRIICRSREHAIDTAQALTETPIELGEDVNGDAPWLQGVLQLLESGH